MVSVINSLGVRRAGRNSPPRKRPPTRVFLKERRALPDDREGHQATYGGRLRRLAGSSPALGMACSDHAPGPLRAIRRSPTRRGQRSAKSRRPTTESSMARPTRGSDQRASASCQAPRSRAEQPRVRRVPTANAGAQGCSSLPTGRCYPSAARSARARRSSASRRRRRRTAGRTGRRTTTRPSRRTPRSRSG